MWYNVGASIMEEIRIFERRCLRACLNVYKSRSSDYIKYVKNSTIYDKANINRIDTFMIKLIRNYFASAVLIKNNSLIFPIPYPDVNYIKRCLSTGYVPPEAFVYLDGNGYIQNEEAVPILYHIPRHRANKKILYQPIRDGEQCYDEILKYSIVLPQKDLHERKNVDKKRFWWLDNS